MYNIYGNDDKLNVASMYMDKTSYDWFLWWDLAMKGGRIVKDWDTYKKIFFKRFQDMEEAIIYSNLTHLQ